MSGIYLGVDTGATKSQALLADEQGRILGSGRAGPGNWEMIGWDGTRAVLAEIIGRAARQAGIEVADITASGMGLAGYDWPEDDAPHRDICREIGLRGPLSLVNDAFLGLVAGAEAGWGVVISAGTSCNCYGRDAQGRIGRLTGSSANGEYAGAGEIVDYARRAVARAWSLRGPQTSLSAVLVEACGAADVDDLLAGLVRGRYLLDARSAPLIFAAADAGDEVAGQAVAWAGRGLGDLACGVIRQLNLQDASFDVVLSGSFFRGSPRLADLIDEAITREAPRARITPLDAPPVTGGVLLAMETRRPAPAPVRRALISAARAMEPLRTAEK